MKRLGKKNTIMALAAFKAARILRKAEWLNVPISDPNLVQYITDAMAMGSGIQINYEGSGWRSILPYGWNTSKSGNILLMCYKDTGEIRSYRLDRILNVQVDSDSQAGESYETNKQDGADMPLEDTLEQNLTEPRPEPSPFEGQINILENDQREPTEDVSEEPVGDNEEQRSKEDDEDVAV